MEFTVDRVDPELGQVLLLDAASFDNKNQRDILVAQKSTGKLVIVKNLGTSWVGVEVMKENVFGQRYEEMEQMSGLPFHLYIRDWN